MDLVIANLENPLVDGGCAVPGKCTLRGAVGWAQVLKDVGVHAVTLANNHIMDYGKEGLLSTLDALDQAGIQYVGAGQDIAGAEGPLLFNIKGKKIALIARTSVVVASPSYAGESAPGVAFFDLEQTVEMVGHLKKTSDYVVLLIHWGLEEYLYPSPDQRKQAKILVEAGVDLILGHHPHVLQGTESIQTSLVNYSAGNFFFDEFFWSFINRDGEPQEAFSKLSDDNRKGMILQVEFLGQHLKYDCTPTFIEETGTIRVEQLPARTKQLKRLSAVLKWPFYSRLWRLYAVKKEFQLRILPMISGKLTWSTLKKVRLRHFKQLFGAIRRSSKIASEKSTNPYE